MPIIACAELSVPFPQTMEVALPSGPLWCCADCAPLYAFPSEGERGSTAPASTEEKGDAAESKEPNGAPAEHSVSGRINPRAII